VKLLAILVVVAFLAVSCGKSNGKIYSLAKTRSCLASAGVRLGGKLDFVATTATGGAVRAQLKSNFVTIVFGTTTADADNIDQAYRHFSSSNVGIDDVLRQQGNAVMLWHEHPADADLAQITGCLK
jgi:hypothetical protein